MVRVRRGSELLKYHRLSQFHRRFGSMVRRRIERRVPATWLIADHVECQIRSDAVPLLTRLFDRRARLWPDRHCMEIRDGEPTGTVTFLNESRNLKRDDETGIGLTSIDWNPAAPRLWRFHLQCQESLPDVANDCGAATAWKIIRSWIDCARHQDPRIDPDAWHPFCISRRLPIWLMLAARHPPPVDLHPRWSQSLCRQVHWLRTHQEYDIGGNHLLENLRALAMAGLTTEGDARVDLDRLRDQISQELLKQILPTGEHFERAPTYHVLIQLAVDELAELFRWAEGDSPFVRTLDRYSRRMTDMTESILHPDGHIPLLGDSVFGETPLPQVLCDSSGALSDERVTKPSEPSRTCGSAGSENQPQTIISTSSDYWTSRVGKEHFLLVDFGQMTCDHLPAHGHADLFNLEASINGKRVFVDSGTYDYEDSQMRAYCRSTAAHNTLEINGESHADVWSRFRMGRRGHVHHRQSGEREISASQQTCRSDKERVESGPADRIAWSSAWHDAYRHLDVMQTGRLVVSRCPGRSIDPVTKSDATNRSDHRGIQPDWVVVDWVRTLKPVELTNRLYFHPDMTPELQSSDRVQFEVGRESDRRGRYCVDVLGSGDVRMGSGWYCPDFGVRVSNSVLTHHSVAGSPGDVSAGAIAWCGWRIRSSQSDQAITVEISDGVCSIGWPDTTFQLKLPR